MKNQKPLTFKKYCKYLGVGETKGRELLQTGTIKSRKVRGQYYVHPKDIIEYLEKNQI